MSPEVTEYWNLVKTAIPFASDSRLYDVFYFGDSEALADELAVLVCSGTKRGTASSLWSLEAEGKRPPCQGDLSIVTNWAGKPFCTIETSRGDIIPFSQVGADFAALEGEGDGSLAEWRAGHNAYFARECARLGRPFEPDMPVVCEHFQVVHIRFSQGAA